MTSAKPLRKARWVSTWANPKIRHRRRLKSLERGGQGHFALAKFLQKFDGVGGCHNGDKNTPRSPHRHARILPGTFRPVRLPKTVLGVD